MFLYAVLHPQGSCLMGMLNLWYIYRSYMHSVLHRISAISTTSLNLEHIRKYLPLGPLGGSYGGKCLWLMLLYMNGLQHWHNTENPESKFISCWPLTKEATLTLTPAMRRWLTCSTKPYRLASHSSTSWSREEAWSMWRRTQWVSSNVLARLGRP